jgi:hypothetical protein
MWHPGAVRRTHPDAGSFRGGGHKLVWHTTEVAGLPNYGGSAPHFTLDPADGRLWQHIPLNRAARALMEGGPNFWNTVQVELIGYADTDLAKRRGTPARAVVNWRAGHYSRIAELARWIESNFGVPRRCAVDFVGNGHTAHLASLDAVKSYAGHLGHQHVNGNTHWDPGLFKIKLVLGKARPAAAPKPAHPTATAAPAARDLGRGDTGPDIRALQKILVKRGYGLLKPDGVFGRATEAFVVHFQWKHGLHIDGVVDENTRAALGLGVGPAGKKKGGLELGLGKPLEEHVEMPAGKPAGPKITVKTKLIAKPRATDAQLEGYLVGRPHGGYSEREVREIARHYEAATQGVGLDPLLVVAQMVLETDNLSSFWSQPPRRNPAGIGVTGEAGAGISFPSWKAAVTAHVGRLLAYTLAKGEENEKQRRLIDKALKVRALPDSSRGVAPTLNGLAGTWAADRQYATKIAAVANEIRAATG